MDKKSIRRFVKRVIRLAPGDALDLIDFIDFDQVGREFERMRDAEITDQLCSEWGRFYP